MRDPGTRSRFGCPRCGVALTPWLRALPLAEALCLQEDETWLVPGGWFARRDAPLLRGTFAAAGPAEFPWLLAPLGSRWLRIHPDPTRTVGCCGLSFSGPANLVCACGAEVGAGYRDCIGPHWYALHRSVAREEVADADPPGELAARLERARARVSGALPAIEPATLDGPFVAHDDASWAEAPRWQELRLACGGGLDEPSLALAGAALPADAALVLPIPWCQLVRLLVLAEAPWGDPDAPLTWKASRAEAPQVQVSRRADEVLLTAWRRETTTLRADAAAWADAWARLRG